MRSGSQRPWSSTRLQFQKAQGTAEKRVNNVRCTLIANLEEFTILSICPRGSHPTPLCSCFAARAHA